MPYTGNLVKFNRDVSNRIVGTALTEIFPDQPYDFQNLANKNLVIVKGVGDVLTVGVILASPDNANWGTVSVIGGGTLGSSPVPFEYNVSNDSRKWWKVQGAVATAAPASYATVSAFWRFS